jgi:hypothetical protein
MLFEILKIHAEDSIPEVKFRLIDGCVKGNLYYPLTQPFFRNSGKGDYSPERRLQQGAGFAMVDRAAAQFSFPRIFCAGAMSFYQNAPLRTTFRRVERYAVSATTGFALAQLDPENGMGNRDRGDLLWRVGRLCNEGGKNGG